MRGKNASKSQRHIVAIIRKNEGFDGASRVLETQCFCTSSWPEIEETSSVFWG